MGNFNINRISIVVGRNYSKAFPDRKGKITIFSHGIRTDESPERILNAFYCYDPNWGCIGWAIHLADTKILRFYNHEGSVMGLETNMVFKPINKRKIVKTKIDN